MLVRRNTQLISPALVADILEHQGATIINVVSASQTRTSLSCNLAGLSFLNTLHPERLTSEQRAQEVWSVASI